MPFGRIAGRLVAAAALACSAPAGRAADTEVPLPAQKPVDPDYARAKKAIEAKNWPEAVKLLEQAATRQESNPNVHNLLGYAERHQGHMEAAFAHYRKALALDPKHRGAHEYVGEAYLQVGDPAKAEEHLAQLAKICSSSCEEYRDLKAKIEDYKREHAGSGR